MIRIDDHKTPYIFDPFGHLGPKRRKQMEESWAGLFRKYILTELPVEVLAKKFPLRVGHPTKEIYAILDLTAALSNVSLLLNNFFDFPTCLSVIIQAPP